MAISLALLVLSFLPSIQAAEITTCPTGKCPESDNYCIYFFYGETCPHCAAIHPFVKDIASKYTKFTLKNYEIYYNSTNQELFQDFASRYKIERPGVPIIFIGERALIGETVIRKNLESTIKYYSENKPVCPLQYNRIESTQHDISPTEKIQLTLPAIILAAAADSINPCAFAVLIFLILYITTLGASKRTLKIGLIYILTVFIVYFLAGLGLLKAIQSIGITRIIFNIAAWIAILAGLINIKDFFWYGKGITLAIPKSKKPIIEKYVAKASISAAITLGILVALFELPCTGGAYLAILSLIAKNVYNLAIPYLLLYNLIFVLPLIIILLLIYFGLPAEKAEKFRLEKRKWLRLIIGLVMLALGLAMLMGIFG